MKTDIFAKTLTAFLTEYLPLTKNVSKNTISSYCDSFRLLLMFFRDEKNIPPERMKLVFLTGEAVKDFLSWLQNTRHCSISTCNQRLAAVHAFAKYCQIEQPQHLEQLQRILQTPFKKTATPTVSYLSPETVQLLLKQPDTKTSAGRRDLTLLSLLYDTGARVQEIVDLRVRDIHPHNSAYVTLTGKGRKSRNVPLLTRTAQLIAGYINENKLDFSEKMDQPLFTNRQGNKLTRSGVAFILKKYADAVRTISRDIPDKITPHIMRHTKAMHLAEANVNPIYIRDILGHSDISTIGIYIKSSMKMKRDALEKATIPQMEEVPSWAIDAPTLDWLKNYGKSYAK